jgi:uncharacterized protein
VHDAARLDVAAFAAEAARLDGEWPGTRLERLAQSQSPPQDVVPAAVHWQASGERRPVPGAEAEIWLRVRAQTAAWMTCQRCLQPVVLPLEVDRRIRFVRGESQAEALDAEIDDDVLALPRRLDLAELVEDELLLALPLAPRHSQCPQALPSAAETAALAEPQATHRPFEVLAGMGGIAGRRTGRN